MKKQKIKSTIITKLKIVDYLTVINLLFYLTYNTILGWNETPQSHLEEILDNIAVITLYVTAGIMINIVFSYIHFKMNRFLYYANRNIPCEGQCTCKRHNHS